MLAGTSRNAVSPIRIQGANSTAIKVENPGQVVHIGDTPHQHTNHYIKESREYFPRSNLQTYFCGSFCLRRFSVLCLVASFFGALSANPSLGKEVAVFFLVLDILWIALFAQHEYVNKKSLPIVLQQPVFDEQSTLNEFYNVTITDLSGVTLENYRAGIGFVKMSQETIKFQAFNKKAAQSMYDARRFSRIMLFMFVCLLVYNFYFCVM